MELEVKYRAKITRWLGAGCAVAVMCACVSPLRTLGQASAASSKTGNGSQSTTAKSRTAGSQTSKSQTSNSKRASARPASPQKHVAAAAKGSARPTSQARSHSTSHVAASAHPKSSASASAHNSKSKYAASRKTGNSKPGNKKTARGQQKIDSERAQAIQEALIRVHYLDGEPAGTWNESSEDAMRRYQADHGWQSKVVPDSRALISLGLGPSHEHLLNPESAMTTEPAAPHAESLTPTSHSADPGTSVNTPPVAPVATTPPENSSKPQ